VELQLHAFLTSVLNGGEWSAALPSGKETTVSTGWKAGWATQPVWTRFCREKFPDPAGGTNLPLWIYCYKHMVPPLVTPIHQHVHDMIIFLLCSTVMTTVNCCRYVHFVQISLQFPYVAEGTPKKVRLSLRLTKHHATKT